MYVVKKTSKSGKLFYVISYDSGGFRKVTPACEYIKMRAMNGDSDTILYNHAYHLKLFFEYLEYKKMTYVGFVIPEKGRTIYDNLIDYRTFLMYHKNVESINVISINKRQVRKNGTINVMMSTIKTFYRYLSIKEGTPEINTFVTKMSNAHFNSELNEMFMTKNRATKDLITLKAETAPLKYITREQFFKLWDLCSCRRDRIILGLGFFGGLRIGETLGLNLEDLRDIYKNVIYIEERHDADNPDARIKTAASIGLTVVPDFVRDEIIDYINIDLKGIDTNVLIINFKGDRYLKPMLKTTVNKTLNRLGKKIGIPNLHSHMLRHGCAVDMLRQGFDMVAISDKLRHASINTTAQIYAKYDIEKKYEVANKYAESIDLKMAAIDVDMDKLFKELGDDTDE